LVLERGTLRSEIRHHGRNLKQCLVAIVFQSWKGVPNHVVQAHDHEAARILQDHEVSEKKLSVKIVITDAAVAADYKVHIQGKADEFKRAASNWNVKALFDLIRPLYKAKHGDYCKLQSDIGEVLTTYEAVRNQFKAYFQKLLEGTECNLADVVNAVRNRQFNEHLGQKSFDLDSQFVPSLHQYAS
jgi:hypothetical protein